MTETPEVRAKNPVLSLIMCSRNDDYQRGALWRLQTGLNLTAQTVHRLGLQNSVEVILTDWGSSTPLRQVLCLTPEAASLVSILEVPARVAQTYQRDAPFSEVHALNAAARRARGRFIGRIDQDTILGAKFFEKLFQLYEQKRSLEVPLERALMLSNRRGVPYRLASTCPTPWVVARYLAWFGSLLRQANPLPDDQYYKSYVGIWLIHRDRWFDIKGYDESFIYINWMEVDMILRLEPDNQFVNLGRVIDHDIYHLDHMHPLSQWGARGRVRKENPVRDREHPPPTKSPNDSDWGLAREDLQPRPYQLKPGEAEAAAALLSRPRWSSFFARTVGAAFRWLLDRITLGVIEAPARLVRSLLGLAPSLRERVFGYRNTLKGQPLSAWPRLARAYRESRRRSASGDESEIHSRNLPGG